MAQVHPVAPTGNPGVDGLLSGLKWAVTSLSFGFPSSGEAYGVSYGEGENQNGFAPLSAIQQSAIQSILNQYASVASLTFALQTGAGAQTADLRFGETAGTSTAHAYLPTSLAEGGDVWLNPTKYDAPTRGGYAYLTLMHEIGHALGLKHPHEAEGPFGVMPASYDEMEQTMMSYRSYSGAPLTGYVNETWGFAQTLMAGDIAAIQAMYGANYATRSGDTTYSWSPATGEMFVNGVGQGAPGGNRILATIWDGGGTDTYDFGNYSGGVTADLRPGSWSRTAQSQLARLHHNGSQVAAGNIANALLYQGDQRSLIENAFGGSGADTLIGNLANNVLRGLAGADALYGGGGNDALLGDEGNDRLWGQDGDDRLYGWFGDDVLWGDAGDDELRGEQDNDVLWGGAGQDLLWGWTGNDALLGDDGHDTLWGQDGDDRLYGWFGDDILWGEAGNDELRGEQDNDVLWGGAGQDLLWGWTGNDALLGDDGNDILWGQDGDDRLYGWYGDDILWGEAGDDELRGEQDNDVLWGGAGQDLLWGWTGNDALLGDEGNDTLWGQDGDDRLYGWLGEDVLVGGPGNDELRGEQGRDTFVFNRNEGIDRIIGFEGGDGLGDVIQILLQPAFDTFDEVRGAATFVNGNLELHLEGTILVLEGYSDFSQLRENDFLFV
jgi:serralysin